MKLNLKMIALIIGSSVVLSCNTHHNKKSKMKNQLVLGMYIDLLLVF